MKRTTSDPAKRAQDAGRTKGGVVAAVLVAVLSVSGCSQLSDRPNQGPGVSAQAETASAEDTAPHAALPYFVGLNLADATSRAAALKVKVTSSDATAAARQVRNPYNWIVVAQSIDPTALSRGSSVKLGVIRRGDSSTATTDTAASVRGNARIVVPSFIGLNLDDAVSRAERLGLRPQIEDASEDRRSIWWRSNWKVVAQDRERGSLADTNDRIELQVLKNEENAPVIDEPRYHYDEMQFIGTVTGYETDYDFSPVSRVVVDDAPVDLDLIWTYAAACPGDVDETRAIQEKEKLLAVGTEVLVLRTDPEDENKGVIHLLSQINDDEMFSGSANERLVATGYWAPSGEPFNEDEVAYSSAAMYTLNDLPITEAQAIYAPYILAAANLTRAGLTGGQGECIETNLVREEEDRRYREESEERERQFWIDFNNRQNSGGGCRDGDGDGICYED